VDVNDDDDGCILSSSHDVSHSMTGKASIVAIGSGSFIFRTDKRNEKRNDSWGTSSQKLEAAAAAASAFSPLSFRLRLFPPTTAAAAAAGGGGGDDDGTVVKGDTDGDSDETAAKNPARLLLRTNSTMGSPDKSQ